jgi:hypothetical protein|tara:strand:- start:53 stop:292 length:240 start_codon:yes stop_codon:yes gene_type:complete
VFAFGLLVVNKGVVVPVVPMMIRKVVQKRRQQTLEESPTILECEAIRETEDGGGGGHSLLSRVKSALFNEGDFSNLFRV